jgi:NAD(P)H-dependent FMN reductase
VQVHIVVADGAWAPRFVDALRARAGDEAGRRLTWDVVDLRRSDWLDAVAAADVVVWRSPYLGHEFAGYLKERIYFLERFAGN